MQLSLEIIVDELVAMEPLVDIRVSERTLSGLLLSCAEPADPQDGKLLCYPSGTGVECLASSGSLYFPNAALEDIFNLLIEIFDRYRTWKERLRLALLEGDSWQKAVDVLEEAFARPLYIANRHGRLLGLTQAYVNEPIARDWLIIARDRQLNFSAFQTMREYPLKGAPEITPVKGEGLCRYVQCPLIPSDPYGLVLYVLEWQRKLTQRDIHLAQLFQEAIKEVNGENRYEYPPVSAIFQRLTEGAEVKPEEMLWALLQLGWVDVTSFSVLLFRRADKVDVYEDRLLIGQLLKVLPRCSLFIHKESVVLIAATEDRDIILEVLGNLKTIDDYFYGVSLPFSSWDMLGNAVLQAELSVAYGLDRQRKSVFCEDAIKQILPYLFRMLLSPESYEHPAVKILRANDFKHGSELLLTLYHYISLERSIATTAKELNVHRNTLRYRLEAIEKLCTCNWDDPFERVTFLLSCKAQF